MRGLKNTVDVRSLIHLYVTTLEARGYPIRDVQVLCPMNRGSLGVRELNTALQKVLTPTRPGQPAVERFGWRFHTGDKVIQTENDYDKDVFNGDVGIVERIDAVEQQVAVRFDERLVKYDFGELDEISLA